VKQMRKMLPEAACTDPTDKAAVGHGFSLGCSLGGILFCLGRIGFCLATQLAISGSSNIEVPSLFVGGGPREEGEKTIGEVMLIRRRERVMSFAVFFCDLEVKQS
jgi:hypothetical protein